MPEVVFGGFPSVTTGLGLEWVFNPKAPVASGAYRCLGIPEHFEVSCVPSPRHPDGTSVVSAWHEAKYGPGGWADATAGPLVSGAGPWTEDHARTILQHDDIEPDEWVWDAAIAYIDACVERFGAWPVTFNPFQAQFGTVVHHLDPDFYDEHYRPGYLTARHRRHDADWHPGA